MDGQNAASSSASQNKLFERATEYIIRATTTTHGRTCGFRPDTAVYSLDNPGLWVNLVALSGQGFTLDVFPVNLDGKPVYRCRHHIRNRRELDIAAADYMALRQSEVWADIKDLPLLKLLDGLLQHLQQA